MTWAIPSQGGSVSHDDVRFRQAEVDGIVFQAATDDPEVTDGQLQAMVNRMVDQYYEARGETAPARDDDPSARLTPLPSELPTFPSNGELERQYAETPDYERDWIDPWRRSREGDLRQEPEGRVLPNRDRNAFPVFNLDGTFQGIYVAGLGVVDRDVYEDPGFDPEHATSDRF